jgi:hypothetical protein
LLTIVLVGAAVLLDLSGRRLDRAALWIFGAHMALAALLVGVITFAYWLGSSVGRFRWRGLAAWFDGLVLIGVARLLRGAAGVAPDAPLIGAAGLGGLLLLFGWWRRARAQRSAAISTSL